MKRLAALALLVLAAACEKSYPPAGAELDAYRRVLEQNRALNARYRDVTVTNFRKQTFDQFFDGIERVRDDKRALLGALDAIRPNTQYEPLERALRNSIASDLELLGITRESMKLTLSSMTNMRAITGSVDSAPPRAANDAQRQQVLKQAALLQGFLHYTTQQMEELQKQEKAARVRSVERLDALNDEIARLGLPYKHDDVFASSGASRP